ncbi:MAG TPA: hybrid sensor histidine kinase/response regulator [Aggregatilineales bacterium]|nr:hybrid sensor histidine kinase/response regulator [Aggregatilineales bacterium]
METNKQITVLVVEDNEDLRENAALVLKLEDYGVYTAADGQEALEMLLRGDCHPDLIVSDIAMPRMDGYQFFQAVHEMPDLKVVPFIFLSAFGTRGEIKLGKQMGADDYLVKPFDADEFKAAVKNKLQRAHEIREHEKGKLDDARRTMVQLLSHELRTPLTYVTGGFSLLADGIQQNSHEVEFSMGLIKSGTQRLNRLAEQVVQYAELISGSMKAHMDIEGSLFDLEYLVRNALAMVERDLTDRNIHYVLDIHLAQPVEIFGLQELLTTAFYEVLRNAASYSDEGGKVTVRVFNDGSDAITEVIDTGRGIPPENQALVWDILSQSERQRYEQQGAGMGLPLVKQIMMLHRGKASLVSAVNEGTTVTLRLPIQKGE